MAKEPIHQETVTVTKDILIMAKNMDKEFIFGMVKKKSTLEAGKMVKSMETENFIMMMGRFNQYHFVMENQ